MYRRRMTTRAGEGEGRQMTRGPGRDQRAPMERLVRLIGALNGRRDGAPLTDLLVAVAGAGASDPQDPHGEATRKMLQRDVDHLNALGYDIRNVGEPGRDGVFVMRARDNRLQVHLSPQQRGELLRAALAAGLEGMDRHLGGVAHSAPGASGVSAAASAASSTALDLVQRAMGRHCLVHFTYKGEPRRVHPAHVHSGPSGWYLSGREDAHPEVLKEFVVARMSEVRLDPPGSAEVVLEPVRRSLDPLTWEVDAPTEVVVALPPEYQVLAENLLGTPISTRRRGDSLELSYRVTHRRIFRFRIYELGTRVRVLSPPDVRAELLEELRAMTVAP